MEKNFQEYFSSSTAVKDKYFFAQEWVADPACLPASPLLLVNSHSGEALVDGWSTWKCETIKRHALSCGNAEAALQQWKAVSN